MTRAFSHRFLSFRWFVGLLTYLFMCRQFFCTNALLQPSLGAMTALPMTGFHRTQISPHGRQYFRNTATFGILPCILAISDSQVCSQYGRFFPCPGLSPDSLVQRTRMRVRLFGSHICHKSHAIQLYLYMCLILRTQKDLSFSAKCQTKEVLIS